MRIGMQLGFLVVAAAAVVVAAWIGQRATDRHTDARCFGNSKGAIACVDPAKGRVTYRVYFIDSNNKVQSLPSG
jgi:hypothetical protein